MPLNKCKTCGVKLEKNEGYTRIWGMTSMYKLCEACYEEVKKYFTVIKGG